MYKAIVFSRVSTEAQNIDAQHELVMEWAQNNRFKNYSINEIHELPFTESGEKLADDDREGIQKLYAAIEIYPDIESVFVSELSRLSRRPKTLNTLKDFFVRNRINLCMYDTHTDYIRS